MACPDCGSSFGEYRISSSVETHGLDCGPFERFEQEFIVCRECGGGQRKMNSVANNTMEASAAGVPPILKRR